MLQTDSLYIYEGTPFGNIMLQSSFSELYSLGFRPGDSINVHFSNGTVLDDIPFLSGCILPEGMLCLNAHEGFSWVRIEKRFGRAWDLYEISESETAVIILNESQKYAFLQDTFNAGFSLSRDCYPSDEAFANYRPLRGGNIKENRFYRSTASFDPYYDRPEFIARQKMLDNLLCRDRIQFVVNMTCSNAQMETIFSSRVYNGAYLYKLYEAGGIYSDLFPADFSKPEFKSALLSALRVLMDHEGPYLIQCRAGLDRTGFVSGLLEALAGANPEEIAEDYMCSYGNLCGLTKEKDPQKYGTILRYQVDRILKTVTYGSAEAYLEECGMSAFEISRLKQILSE